MDKKNFIPAWHYNFLTPLYKPFMDLFFGGTFKTITKLINLKPNETLLDLGCGPGSLLRVLHKKHPSNKLIGLDIDSKILKIAQSRLSNKIKLIESSAIATPLPNNSFDVVISTLAIHHLQSADKERMIAEAHRILKTGGHFFLFDYTKPYSSFGRIFVALFRKSENMDNALEGKYTEWMKKAGFKEVKSIYRNYGMLELLFTKK